MATTLITDKQVRIKFNLLIHQIRKSKNISNLDKMHNTIDLWSIELESLYEKDLKGINALGYILRDEIKRTESLLHNRRSKQAKMNWENELKSHARRLGEEKLLLESFQLELKHKTAPWSELISSFKFSIELVSTDIEQMKKELTEDNLCDTSNLRNFLLIQEKLLSESKRLLNNL